MLNKEEMETLTALHPSFWGPVSVLLWGAGSTDTSAKKLEMLNKEEMEIAKRSYDHARENGDVGVMPGPEELGPPPPACPGRGGLEGPGTQQPCEERDPRLQQGQRAPAPQSGMPLAGRGSLAPPVARAGGPTGSLRSLLLSPCAVVARSLQCGCRPCGGEVVWFSSMCVSTNAVVHSALSAAFLQPFNVVCCAMLCCAVGMAQAVVAADPGGGSVAGLVRQLSIAPLRERGPQNHA